MSATGFLDLFLARSRSTPEALFARFNDLTLKFGDFTMGAIGTATFGAIILYQISRVEQR